MNSDRQTYPFELSVIGHQEETYDEGGARREHFVCYDTVDDITRRGAGRISLDVDYVPLDGQYNGSLVNVCVEFTKEEPEIVPGVGNRETISVFRGEVDSQGYWINFYDRKSGEYVGETHFDEQGYIPESLGTAGDHMFVTVHMEWNKQTVFERSSIDLDTNRTTGGVRLNWQFNADSSLSRPVVGEDTVVVGSKKSVYGIEKSTDDVRWCFSPDSDVRQIDPLRPTLEAGCVYFADAGGTVYALDIETGDSEWETKIGSGPTTAPTLCSCTGETDSAEDHSRVLIQTREGRVHALESDTGRQSWTVETSGPTRATPVVNEGHLYTVAPMDEDGIADLLRVDCADGEQDVVCEGYFDPLVAVDGETAFVIGSSIMVYAVDVESGDTEELYERPGSETGFIHLNPVVAGDTILLTTVEGPIYAVDADSGEELWQREWCAEELDVIGGTVYTTARQAAVAVDIETGDVLWRYPTGVGHLTATENGIYAVGENDDGTSTLYALAETDGT